MEYSVFDSSLQTQAFGMSRKCLCLQTIRIAFKSLILNLTHKTFFACTKVVFACKIQNASWIPSVTIVIVYCETE